MQSPSRFPKSARAAWLASKAQRTPRRPPPLTPEAREVRALAKSLAPLLREATRDQLHQVARILGKTPQWVDLVCLEARNPGVVGKACLEAAR